MSLKIQRRTQKQVFDLLDSSDEKEIERILIDIRENLKFFDADLGTIVFDVVVRKIHQFPEFCETQAHGMQILYKLLELLQLEKRIHTKPKTFIHIVKMMKRYCRHYEIHLYGCMILSFCKQCSSILKKELSDTIGITIKMLQDRNNLGDNYKYFTAAFMALHAVLWMSPDNQTKALRNPDNT